MSRHYDNESLQGVRKKRRRSRLPGTPPTTLPTLPRSGRPFAGCDRRGSMKDYFDEELLPVDEPVPEPAAVPASPVPASPVPAPLASAELVDEPVEP